ncbi:hypothetical protein AB0M80_43215 [Amycolatopsis sp. NPDC051045]|uniref:hypothetical protein n=1 Tax=Amycolatopsis sp. NPDC051045 TaxID=3156922 RepID=UPI0034375B25
MADPDRSAHRARVIAPRTMDAPRRRFGQRVLEKVTVRMLGDYQPRRSLPLLDAAGFDVSRSERRKLGTVERVAAVKR